MSSQHTSQLLWSPVLYCVSPTSQLMYIFIYFSKVKSRPYSRHFKLYFQTSGLCGRDLGLRRWSDHRRSQGDPLLGLHLLPGDPEGRNVLFWLVPRLHALFSECPLQASNNHPEGHLQGGGPGHAGVCLHRGGEWGPEQAEQAFIILIRYHLFQSAGECWTGTVAKSSSHCSVLQD